MKEFFRLIHIKRNNIYENGLEGMCYHMDTLYKLKEVIYLKTRC